MALIDVPEVIGDPLFTSAIRLVDRVETFDEYGNPIWEERLSADVQAVVTSDIKTIERLPEALRQTGTILVRFLAKYAPEGFSGKGYDEIEYRGRRYTVQDRVDYTQFGDGHLRLVCVPKDVNDE